MPDLDDIAPLRNGPRRSDARPSSHIVLVGFMGAGKTVVGTALAGRIGLKFIDLDQVIAEKTRQTIPEIFRAHGEVGFRARERGALREVLETETCTVIAVGGGTFVDPSMRDWIQRHARSVYLRAEAEVLMERIGSGQARAQRPMLAGPDPQATVRRLLDERGPTYEQAEYVVNTTAMSIEQVVQSLVETLRLDPSGARRRRVDSGGSARRSGASPLIKVQAASGSYQVEIRKEAGAWIAGGICDVLSGARIAVISDTTVAPLHAEGVVSDLRARGKLVSVHTFTPGEQSKTLGTAARLYDELLAESISRADALVAVGGGVVGDVTGFVASTLLRGVGFVQVPTTTLAAVDSSVGGKTAVNTPQGKNLVGTFYQPRAVFVATDHLKTLPEREHAAGLVEALKMAATLDADLFETMVERSEALLGFDSAALLPVLSRSVQLKASVVARDETEQGERAVLNFGHTIGHAIERGEAYRLLHGEAVALGMVAEAEWAETEGLSPRITGKLDESLRGLGLPTAWRQVRVDLTALGLDKKRIGNSVRLPVVPIIGSFELRSVPVATLVEFVKRRTAA